MPNQMGMIYLVRRCDLDLRKYRVMGCGVGCVHTENGGTVRFDDESYAVFFDADDARRYQLQYTEDIFQRYDILIESYEDRNNLPGYSAW